MHEARLNGEPEIELNYPREWEDEYRATGAVSRWLEDFRDQFESVVVASPEQQNLQLFAQYALVYLLRKRFGIHSLTWYKLASTKPHAKNRARTDCHWEEMRKWMGSEAFRVLQDAIIRAGFSDFTGEPDLFCWHPESGAWFFAEAKGRDRLIPSQVKWFRVARAALGPLADIRVYRLRPE